MTGRSGWLAGPLEGSLGTLVALDNSERTSPPFKLVLERGRREWFVGRDITCEFTVLGDTEVSRRHARIACLGELPHIEDLGSLNGTRINGELLRPGVSRLLQDGDLIGIGGALIRFNVPNRQPAADRRAPNSTV